MDKLRTNQPLQIAVLLGEVLSQTQERGQTMMSHVQALERMRRNLTEDSDSCSEIERDIDRVQFLQFPAALLKTPQLVDAPPVWTESDPIHHKNNLQT